MQTIRVRYTTVLSLRQDLRRVFPNWDGTIEDYENVRKKRHMRIKVYRDPVTNVRTHADVYLLVRDTFTVPSWVQGTIITSEQEPYDHTWMGHEIPVPDAPSEEPEEEIT